MIMQLCIWRKCQCSPTFYGWVAYSQIQCQLFCPVINITMSNNLNILKCTLHNFPSLKARFSHTITVIRLHSCSGKKIRVRLACILFLYRNQYFWTFLRQNIQQKVLVFHSVLLGACPQPCSKRADTILY